MDRDAMITDLESSFDAERHTDLVAQSVELAEAERVSIELVDRLWGSVGRLTHLQTRGGVPVDGVARRVEPSYIFVDEGEGLQTVVSVNTVTTVASLAGPAPRDGRCRPTLTALMRGIAWRGARVRLVLDSGEVVGRLVQVGASHVDVATNPEGDIHSCRASGVGGVGVVSVMIVAIGVLRSRWYRLASREIQGAPSSFQPVAIMTLMGANWHWM